jgi:hypothetical protein
MYRVAGAPTGWEILLFGAMKGTMMEADISRRTAYYHFRELEKLGVLERVYSANSRIRSDYFRHPATYRLNLAKLTRDELFGRDVCRQTYIEYKAKRPLSGRIQPQSEKISPPPPDPVVVMPARTEQPEKIRRLSDRQTGKLLGKMAELMKGFAGSINTKDGIIFVEPGDPRYRKPMSKYAAMMEACKVLGISVDQAIETLVASGHKIEPEGEA